MPMTVKQVWFN